MKKVITLFFSFTMLLPLLMAQQKDNELLIIQKQKLLKQKFEPSDLAELVLVDHYESKGDIEHYFYHQFYDHIPVEAGILHLIVKSGKLVSSNHALVQSVSSKINISVPSINAETGLKNAMNHLKINGPIPAQKAIEKNKVGANTVHKFNKEDIARSEIISELKFVRENEELILAWDVSIDKKGKESEYYDVAISAENGQYVRKINRVLECAFEHSLNSPNKGHVCKSKTQPQFDKIENQSLISNSYRVFDLPLESPNHGNRTYVTEPWLRTGMGNPASTLGWHNDGVTNYDITRGNNVYAYEDSNNDNLPGYSPSNANLDFDYPLDPVLTPNDNRDASITNLFFMNNIIHDIMYQYGFDEAAGNFQHDNLGRGGISNDEVLAEALDGGGTNNANFSLTKDGQNGRMQMYTWSAVEKILVQINSPLEIAGELFARESSFSRNNKLIDVGPVTGDLIVALDAMNNSSEGCDINEISNSDQFTGKIALIDRGNCTFIDKVSLAQSLGAIAAIVVNNAPNEDPIIMSGNGGNTIDIPAVMISMNDGQMLKTTAQSSNVNMTLDYLWEETPDGSFDNGIVIHEYGHGISTRLTGGPAYGLCLQNLEQMGEGWSDYFALMLATDWTSSSANDIRGIGTYAIGESVMGTGIRNFPYSYDMAINPVTYADVANTDFSQPHGVGSIWCSMIWDMTWNIIDMEGTDPDLYFGTGGNNIALQLVIEALKIQPCFPGFVDARNAILLADELLYDGQYKCAIWNAFARRGLGAAADQGSSNDRFDGTEDFSLPAAIRINKSVDKTFVSEGELFTATFEIACDCQPLNNLEIKSPLNPQYDTQIVINGNIENDSITTNPINLAPLERFQLAFTARTQLCEAIPSITMLEDDVENGSTLIPSQINVTKNQQWEITDLESRSGNFSWYAKDSDTLQDIALTSAGFTLAPPYNFLEFYHKFQTEDFYDGGVIEISTDGTTWIDLGPNIVENGYTQVIDAATTSGIAGRPAFAGFSGRVHNTDDFVRTLVDLTPFNGQTVQIRFRFNSDMFIGGSGINGWYIDDISLRNSSFENLKGEFFYQNNLLTSTSTIIQTSAFTGSTAYVDQSTAGSRNGITWENAFSNLNDALAIVGCRDVETVLLAQGTYKSENDRDTSFVLDSNVSIFGGYESINGNRDIINFVSTISGDIGLPGDPIDNNYHVLNVPLSSGNILLDGVTIEDGNADGTGIDGSGAALLNYGSTTLKDVIIANQSGIATGSVILNAGSGAVLTLDNVTIKAGSNILPIDNSNEGIITVKGETKINIQN